MRRQRLGRNPTFQATKSEWESNHRCGAPQINHRRDNRENQAKRDACLGEISDARSGGREEKFFVDSSTSDHLARALRSMVGMAKNSQGTPKIELRGKGVGGFTKSDLERRALELALIDNRTEATDEDRARARREFRDQDLPDALNEDAETTRSLSRDPSDPLVDRGHQVPEYGVQDEDTELQKIALEGVEEAQHEQMVESRNYVDEPLRSRPKNPTRNVNANMAKSTNPAGKTSGEKTPKKE